MEEHRLSEDTEFIAIVREWKPNAMRERYEDGGFASFDLSRLEVVEPTRLAGRVLRIFHEQAVEEGSPWRVLGGTVAFRAAESQLIDDQATVFAGAVHELRAR